MAYERYETLKIEMTDSKIMILTLNRPERLNSVTYKMLGELEDLWGKLRHDRETRVVILQGAGEKGFCGGIDMKEGPPPEAGTDGANFMYEWQSRLGNLQLAMRQIPQPIICLVQGSAAGAGFSFSMASDIRIISPEARFSAFYINVGLGGADMGSSYLLPRLIGTGRAFEFLLTGRFMSAEEAINLGFASRCVEREKLMDTAMELAQMIVQKDYLAIRLTKEAINQNIDCSGFEAALKMEDRNQVLMIMHNMARGRAAIGK
ncbi:MAG: enoyl-CoA hydratase/isomerase family protein [Acidobacteriota bacterium]